MIGFLGIQVFGLKQNPVQESSLPQYGYIPPQRVCGCEELNRCINDQATRDHNLLTACRQECGSRIFLDSTSKKIASCYETFDHKRSEDDSHIRQCVESMGSKQCISDHHIDTPSTFTINTTEFLQAGNKRNGNGNRKLTLPDSINQLNVCTRTCVKNLGIVQFNADGSIVQSNTKTAKNGEKQEQKNGKENGGNEAKTALLCATLLNCQLSPLDKKLEKQAKQLCKFKPGTHEDTEMALCTCLETAVGQNLHCTEQLSPSDSCSSTTAQCSNDKNLGNERR